MKISIFFACTLERWRVTLNAACSLLDLQFVVCSLTPVPLCSAVVRPGGRDPEEQPGRAADARRVRVGAPPAEQVEEPAGERWGKGGTLLHLVQM